MSSERPDDAPERIGKCRILSKLGQGGMGVVYLGHHEDLDIKVAVKMLPPHIAEIPNMAERFIREARLAAKINRNEVVRVIDCGQDDGRYYLVMEYVDGKSVQDKIDAGGPMPVVESMRIVKSVAVALGAALDEVGIIHRDIKPDNIMLTTKGEVKVADLGLAKLLEDQQATAAEGLTAAGTGIGTPNYMSPEQFADASTVDHRADIYSLGATLYHMLMGKRPYQANSVLAVLQKVSSGDLEPLPDTVPQGVQQFVYSMMAITAEERYQTYAEVIAQIDALQQMLGGGPGSSALPTIAAGPRTTPLVPTPLVPTPASSQMKTVPFDARQPTTGMTIPLQAAKPPRLGLWLGIVAGVLVLVGGALVWALMSSSSPTSVDGAEISGGPAVGTGGSQEKQKQAGVLVKDARLLMASKLFDEAKEKVVAALSLVSDHKDAMALLDEIRAKTAASQSKQERTAEYKKWMDKGLELKLDEKYQAAAEAFDKASGFAPAGSDEAEQAAAGAFFAHYKAEAKAAEAKNDLARAMDLYKKALRSKPDPTVQSAYDALRAKLEAGAWVEKARSADTRGEWKSALDFYEVAAKRGADVRTQIAGLRGKIRFQEGLAKVHRHVEQKNWLAAHDELKQIIKLRPDDEITRSLLTRVREQLALPPTRRGPLDVELVLVEGGRFAMGHDAGEPDESPIHQVSVSSFYIGRYEVTQAQFAAFQSQQSAVDATEKDRAEDRVPQVTVSWSEAAAFCSYLTQKDPDGARYRLPREAEWEFAARGSAGRVYPWGNQAPISRQANLAGKRDGYDNLAPVGSFPAGATYIGVNDLIGNAAEWCADWFGPYSNTKAAQSDPTGPRSGAKRVVKGSAFAYDAKMWSRASMRSSALPDSRMDTLGFRVVRELAPDEKQRERSLRDE